MQSVQVKGMTMKKLDDKTIYMNFLPYPVIIGVYEDSTSNLSDILFWERASNWHEPGMKQALHRVFRRGSVRKDASKEL